jgi:hypothetical protein
MKRKIKMTKARNADVSMGSSKSKDKWFCVLFPEQYHQWTYKKPWDKKPFTDAKVIPVSVQVKSSKPVSASQFNEINKKKPMTLDCGIEIQKGRYGLTSQSDIAKFNFRIDSVQELNTVMSELSKKYEFAIWEISKIEIYNNEVGATIEFNRHNPDGLGTGLYLFRVKTSEYDKTYQNIDIFEQERLCKGFYDYFAACTMVTRQVPGCALKHKKVK